ncbi:FUSC family protein [Streptomyces sp. NPDC046805]|uniref:FUSC family protein n=1 Tax=Streptomyces sp. NPDC046805 TaxID=3155134 RepID=UPI0033CF1F98
MTRAVLAAVIVPGGLWLSLEVLGSRPMALFAAFGGFATTVVASFRGTRHHRAVGHLGLAVMGSVLLVVGTVVSTSTLVASLVTLPVAFVSYFAGIAGPNNASGAFAALLAYVLAAATPAPTSVLLPRLEGWWLASVGGGLLVLLLVPPATPQLRLRGACADAARALADHISAALGTRTADTADTVDAAASSREAVDALEGMLKAFISTPNQPGRIATVDQAMTDVVGQLEWCAGLVLDGVRRCSDLIRAAPSERALFDECARTLREVASALDGADPAYDLTDLEQGRAATLARLHRIEEEHDGHADRTTVLFYALAISAAVLRMANDVRFAARPPTPRARVVRRRVWLDRGSRDRLRGRPVTAAALVTVVLRNASLRSVWFLNALRMAVALSTAVAVVHLTGVQSGFWVLLGTLSVLRTSAQSTGAVALSTVGGTVVGVAVGAALLVAIGTSHEASWVALPVAVFVAAYARGMVPEVVNQAAFSVLVLVLFNLLAPAGWQLSLVRLQDILIGTGVALVAGVLVWPRGAGTVVRDNMADTLRIGAAHLTRAVEYALGLRADPGQSSTEIFAVASRLHDALRAYLAEPGSKRMDKQDFWLLVAGGVRLRLTVRALEELEPVEPSPDPECRRLVRHAAALTDFYTRLADHLADPAEHPLPARPPTPLRQMPPLDGDSGVEPVRTRWVAQHLGYLDQQAGRLAEPVGHLASLQHRPWWR